MKRSTKEIAMLLNVESKSIRMSKYRLKQKMNLHKEDDLEAYINKMIT
ncbi:LuxR C-terminal-related transcriptional regulator [Pedobacter africanus]